MTKDTELELYFSDFEAHMQFQRNVGCRIYTHCSHENWSRDLDQEQGYSDAKAVILSAYESEKGSIGLRFLSCKKKLGQTPSQFVSQQVALFSQWTEGLTRTRDEIGKKLVMCQLEMLLPNVCRNIVQLRKPSTPHEMVKEVQVFFVDQGST